jgi:hypothetical protein
MDGDDGQKAPPFSQLHKFTKSQTRRVNGKFGVKRYKCDVRLPTAPRMNPIVTISSTNKAFTEEMAGAIAGYLKLLQKNKDFADVLEKYGR